MRKSLLFSMMALALPMVASAADYCTSTETAARNDRYVTSLEVNGVTVEGYEMTSSARPVYMDRTSTVVNVSPGEEVTVKINGYSIWMHAYLYVDFDQNGWNVDPTVEGLSGDAVWFNYYSIADNKIGHNSDGEQISEIGSDIASFTPHFTVPAETPAGDYRVRFKTDWSYIDPCGRPATASSNKLGTNGGVMIDFTLHVSNTAAFAVPDASDFENIETLAFMAGDDALTAGQTASLEKGSNVTMAATAAAGYVIAGLTVDGVAVELTEEDGTYTGVFAINSDLTKDNFEFTVTKTPQVLTIENPANGTITVTANGETLESGAKVVPGTELTLACSPAAGFNFVNFTLDGEPVDGNTVVMPEAAATISAVVEGLEYCTSTEISSGTDRYVTSFDINGTTVQGPGNAQNRPVYVDRTATVVTVDAGSEVVATLDAGGAWIHTYLYIDLDRNGWNVDPELDVPNGDLYYFNFLDPTFGEAGVGKNSDGESVISNQGMGDANVHFTLPANTEPGEYRARLKTDWNWADPCGRPEGSAANSLSANRCSMIDFTIRVESAYLESARTITIASNNEEAGTIAFVSPASDQKSISSNLKEVKIIATPADGADFEGWYNGEELVSEDAEYIYRGTEDVTLTAHFAWTAKYAVTLGECENGSVRVFNGTEEIASGDEVLYNTRLTLEAVPAAGYRFVNFVVNGTEQTSTSVVVTENVTVSAVFEEGTVEYCTPASTIKNTHSERLLRGLNIVIDGAPDQHVTAHSASGESAYIDRTETIINAEAGQTITIQSEGSGEWMHSYVFADFNRNGWEVDPTIIAPNGDLKSFTFYAGPNGSAYYDSEGNRKVDGHGYYNSFVDKIVVPADAEGDYRIRYKVAWNDCDPCGGGSDWGTLGGTMVDFTLRVISANLDEARNISVAVAEGQDALGSVAITYPETEGTTANTTLRNVVIKATANEHAQFLNWTKDGEVVAETEEYIATDLTDATYVANFGWDVEFAQPEGGAIIVRPEGVTSGGIVSGTAVTPGSKLTVILAPETGNQLRGFTVNGEPVEAIDNQAEITVTGYTVIAAEFGEELYKYDATVTGKGRVEVWTSMDFDNGECPAGEKIAEGEAVIVKSDESCAVFLIPDENPSQAGDYATVVAVTIECGSMGALTIDDMTPCSYNENVLTSYLLPVDGDLHIQAVFSDSYAGIADILFDEANGPVEYYNLQGVRVDSKNLAPGVYILRQGKAAKKVYIFEK